MRMKKLFLLLMTLLVVCSVRAQVTTSGISGTVTDQNGSPLAGATVIAVHAPSGTQYGAVTGREGRYNLQGLRAGGPYTVTFSFVGYQSVEYPQIHLSLGETLARNASLKDSQELEAVVISAEGRNSSMNINRAGAVTSIDSDQIDLMPSVSRSLNDIMKLTPQASSTTSGLAIGGGNYRQSYVTVDGAAFNNMFGIGGNLPAGGAPISLDALEQVSVSVTPFDVRQSGFTGGAINAITKSGTNDLKISAYVYAKSDQLQGDKYDDGKLSLSEMRDNTLGFSIGAPIIRNKLFVFANFEREWNSTPGSSRLARTSESQGFGGNTQYNRPTAGMMNEMRDFLIEKYGYNPGPYQDYSVKTPGYRLMARVDWNIARNHALNVRFSRTQNKNSVAPSSSISPLDAGKVYDRDTYGRTSNYAMYFQNSRYYQEQNFTSVAAELNSRFLEGRLSNTLRYTYSHQYEPRSYDGGKFPTVDILQPTDDGKNALLASFGIDPFTEGNLREVSTHIVTDEVSYMLGKNRLVAGFQFEHDLTTNGYQQGGAGYYVYESWDDFKNDRAPLAFRLAHGNNDALAQAFPQFTYMQYSVYLQDEINFSNRFKATVGLRFEVPVYPTVSNNENKDFTKIMAEHGGYKTSDMPKARVSVAPRIGFNWDMTGERKYILRGGTGIFTGRLPFVWLVSAIGNSNCIQNGITLYRDELTDGKPTKMPSFHTSVNDMLQDVYNGSYQQRDLPAYDQSTILDKHLKMPSTWKSSLALDLKLPGDVNLNVEGIYNKDIHSVTVTKLGMEEVEGGIQMPGEPAARTSWKSLDLKNSAGKAITPYLIRNTDDLDGYYASISAQVSKTWNFGLSVMAAYTYSSAKNVIDGIGDQVTSAFNTNTFNRNGSNVPELGYASYVSPSRFLLNVGYRLAGKKGASNFGLYYEAYRQGFIGSYSYSRYSYTLYTQSGKYQNPVTGDRGAQNLLYIPTREQLDAMPFMDITDKAGKVTYSADAQKADFWAFIEKDDYLSEHKGEYMKRGGAVMPWQHVLNFSFSQDFYINIGGKRNTITLGLDVNNLANMLNRKWGNVKRLSTTSILGYDSAAKAYMFTQPKWSTYANPVSTWSAMFSIRYTFN